jgi:RNA polymerase sigma-B factor
MRFLPLARKLARRYVGADGPLDDLIQVASLGLLKAIDRFDPARGPAFSSFAVPTILGELKRYFRDLGWAVHVPRAAQEMALTVEHTIQELRDRTGASPSVGGLAEYLEWSVDDVLEALETGAAHHAASMDAPAEGSCADPRPLADGLGRVDPQYERIEASVSIAAAARNLTERERRVVLMRFVDDCTQAEIAERIGVSQMQVSRILRGALGRLRDLLQSP